jgi:demethylmenaquinone methyltransferase/2-methoxy-6-polyprenyl-1,4-benzoquinol methylase
MIVSAAASWSAASPLPLSPAAPPIYFIRADAQQLPFADGAFDIVTVGYGLRNLADWQRGLGEMRRVLKPGGRIVLLEFGRPQSVFWRSIYFSYLRLAVPLLGLIFHGSSGTYAYILESLKHYSGSEAIADKLRGFGLVNVTNRNILGGAMTITYGTLPTENQIRQNC